MQNSVPTSSLGPAPSIFPRAAVWIAIAWAVFLCWAGRHELLDDALIHLRYATVLHDRHFLSFDGIHPSYGASSLLYVGLLALLRSVTQSPLLPKIVSLLAYALLLGLVYWISRRSRLGVALLFILVSPFAVRWLTDGMETSLACLMAVTFSLLVSRKASPLALASTALVLTLLRVDMTLLVAFGVLLLIVEREWLRAGALCAGSALSLAFIQLTMGHLLPDTAIAKVGIPFVQDLHDATHEFLSTVSFGLGVIAIWIVSAALLRSIDRSTIIANLPFPVLILLACIRGQQIHGIRYVIWALLFSIVWNLLRSAAVPQLRPAFLIAFACVLVISWSFELPIVLRVDRGRAENLKAMEQGHLERLHGEGLAADVGFIGYFSRAPICDFNGLVNGRAAAKMSRPQRAQKCVADRPTFLFLSDSQIALFDLYYGMHSDTDFFNCGSVEFTNVGSNDHHTLLVRRTEYPDGCPSQLE
jgi:hypothetical protein